MTTAAATIERSDHVPGAAAARWTTVALMAVLVVVSIFNAFSYPALGGYDAAENVGYAHLLVDRWEIPKKGEGAFYTPPGYFLLAGGATKLGNAIGMGEPEHLGQLVNALLSIGTGLMLLAIARSLFPARPWVGVLGLGAYVMIPVALKTNAMFHPQPLAMFLATAAVLLTTRLVLEGRYVWWQAVLLGLVVGAGQLVRSAGLWAFGVSLLALLGVVIARPEVRRRAAGALVIVGVVGILVPSPWYAYLQSNYGNPIFGRSGSALPAQPTSSRATRVELSSIVPPLALAQPLSYYTTGGLPGSFTEPHRGALPPRFFPVLYTETWGDYFGIWSWGAGTPRPEMSSAINRRLALQSFAGALPTFVALVGWLALLALALLRMRQRVEMLAVALMPLAALAGVFYYASHYVSPDGDTMKGMFLLPAIPCFAIAFGLAVDGIRARSPRLGWALIAILVVCGVVSLAFGIA